MGLASYLRNIIRNEAQAALNAHVSAVRNGGSAPWTYKGNGMSIAAVYRCVKLISDKVACLPIEMRTLANGVYKADRASRLWYLLNVQPTPGMSAFDFWSGVVRSILLTGNAYVMPRYRMGEYSEMVLLPSNSVKHDWEHDLYKVSENYTGVKGTIKEKDILHFAGLGINPKVGLSVLSYASRTLGIASAGEEQTVDRLRTGGVRGIVSNSSEVRGAGKYQNEQMKAMMEDLEDKMADSHLIHMPGQGIQFTQMGMTSADMQFLETRKFTVRDICRFFGVDPSFVFDDTSNNYKSAEMASAAFLSNTLDPILKKIENELTRKLIPMELAPTHKIQFDRQGLYACDLEGRMKYLQSMQQCGLATVNELRRIEDREPVEGGDAVLVSANLKSIEELINEKQQNQP